MRDRVILTRRALLTGFATSLIACDSEHPHRGFLGAMERWNERVQRGLFRADHLARTAGAREQTPAGAFPVYFISPSIPIAPPNWMLRVSGMVARPAVLALEALQRMPRTDVRVRHHCVEGWSAVASWHGVRIRDLAEAVGVDPRAAYVEFRSFDGDYFSSWDRESAFHPQTILAYGMNGELLGPDHGAPLRLYSAVKLGYKMVKYLTDVRFLGERTGGYWEDRGYEWFAGV
jgi:DMSO/TMAO reductase YedYZ molybdopterin-dependent catalytic subunit